MGVPGNANALLLRSAAAAGGYQISRSLRFNSSDSAYLSRTPASAGNRKTWTWAGWVKRSGFAAFNSLFGSYDGSTGSTYFSLIFTTSDTLRVEDISTVFRETTQVFRDPSAWYHIVLAVDTTAGTASNRVRLYVNGTEVTAFNTSNNPTPSADLGINGTHAHGIGRPGAQAAYYFNGYLADIHFIDGQALTPSSFTEVSATTGQLIPKAYTGTFTGNSFWLPFSDNSSTTSGSNVGIGKDFSGLGNYWNTTNLSVTAGAGNDSLVDTPTSYGTDTGAGGEVRGNYCTLNPLDNGGGTLSNGNLDFSNLTAAHRAVRSTIALPNSGKFYAELTVGTTNSVSVGVGFGFATQGANLTNDPANTGKWSIYLDGIRSPTTTVTSGLGYFQANDILQIAYDGVTGNAWVGKNNVWYNSTGGTTGNPGAGTNPTFTLTDSVFPYCSLYNATAVLNGGARAFAYTAPSGFKALVDTNLTAPTIAKPSTVMDVKLYTGNGGTQSITGLGFSPDFVWVKERSSASTYAMWDQVRGASKLLSSNTTTAEDTTGALSSFNSDGFTVVYPNTNDYYVNRSSQTYVAWAWDAGSSTVTNTQGSITSQVRANASSGFSVSTFTSPSSGAFTFGHGLGVAPAFHIVKIRNASDAWYVYHSSLGAGKYLQLNLTAAETSSTSFYNNTAPTSSVITLNGSTWGASWDFVCYSWAPVAGYSNGFSYTGNGSTDGSFVYLGFRPRLILLKCSSTTGNWTLVDTAREGYNVDNDPLYPNLSDAEGTTDLLDITSNGFKLRTTDASVNSNAATYIGFAWAESPFNYSRAR